MSDRDPNSTQGTDQSPEGGSWDEVGHQFQVLGQGIADVFRTAWQDPENRRRMQDAKQGVEAMLNQVSTAIDEAANSPEGQRAQEEARKAVESFQRAYDNTADEVRPQVISALQTLNAELKKFIDQLKQDEP